MNQNDFDRDPERQVPKQEWGKSELEISALAACWGLIKLIWEFVNFLIVRFLYLILRALWVMFRPRKPITVDKSPKPEQPREKRQSNPRNPHR